MAYKEILKKIYLFKDFTAEELDPIHELCKMQNYHQAEHIFFQGDEAKALYVVKFGSVVIEQKGKGDDNIEISRIGSGSHFGEMALLDGGKRSASAIAVEKSEVIQIPYDGLNKYISSNPKVAAKFYKALAQFICGRLRITTTDLSFAREKNLHHF